MCIYTFVKTLFYEDAPSFAWRANMSLHQTPESSLLVAEITAELVSKPFCEKEKN